MQKIFKRRLLQNGQITIPSLIRKELDLKVGDTIILEIRDNVVTLTKGENHNVWGEILNT